MMQRVVGTPMHLCVSPERGCEGRRSEAKASPWLRLPGGVGIMVGIPGKE